MRQARLLRVASPETTLAEAPRGLVKRFGDLKVRPKLMVLHNLFFLVLTVAVYFALIPSFEERVSRAKLIEGSLVIQMFSSDRPGLNLPQMAGYDYREGNAEAVGIPSPVKLWLDEHPDEVLAGAPASDYLYRKHLASGNYRRITLPNTVYDAEVQRAKASLFLVLGCIYGLAVILLEFIIMPRYVYQPIGLMLNADRATQKRDHDHEMIPEDLIPGDEIGQIMRSRNATVAGVTAPRRRTRIRLDPNRGPGPAGQPGTIERKRGARDEYAARGAARLYRKAHRDGTRTAYSGAPWTDVASDAAPPAHQRGPGRFRAGSQAGDGARGPQAADGRGLEPGGDRRKGSNRPVQQPGPRRRMPWWAIPTA